MADGNKEIMFSGHNNAVAHTNIQLLKQPTISKTKIPAWSGKNNNKIPLLTEDIWSILGKEEPISFNFLFSIFQGRHYTQNNLGKTN